MDEEGEVGQSGYGLSHGHELLLFLTVTLFFFKSPSPQTPEIGRTPKLTDHCNLPGFGGGGLRDGSANLPPLAYSWGILLWQC